MLGHDESTPTVLINPQIFRMRGVVAGMCYAMSSQRFASAIIVTSGTKD